MLVLPFFSNVHIRICVNLALLPFPGGIGLRCSKLCVRMLCIIVSIYTIDIMSQV